MEKTERLENLEGCVSRLIERVSKLESAIANIQQSNQANSPYSGDAFKSPYGKPFQYFSFDPTVPMPQMSVQNASIVNDSIINQKLDRLLELFNNNFSRLNFRLDELEKQRKE